MEIEMDKMLESCGIDPFPDDYSSGTYVYAYGEELRTQLENGAAQEEAEAAAHDVATAEEQEVLQDAYDEWEDDAMRQISHVCRGLSMQCGLVGRTITLLPERDKTWDDVADEMRRLINGHGLFYFASLRDFLDSIPCESEQAVQDHLHWLRHYQEVYGG